LQRRRLRELVEACVNVLLPFIERHHGERNAAQHALQGDAERDETGGAAGGTGMAAEEAAAAAEDAAAAM
jgi:hypothetical protein